jgi:hypothetical protein
MSIGEHSLKNLIGEARSAAISVRTNPRNREHNWYPFWGIFVLILMDKIVHRSILASQFPLWRIADEMEDGDEVQGQREVELAEASDIVMDTDNDDNEVQDQREGELAEGSDVMDTDNDESDETDTTFSSAGGSTSEKTRQRLTDFAIVIWDTYSSPYGEDSSSSDSSEHEDEDEDCDNTIGDDEISRPRKLQEDSEDGESPEDQEFPEDQEEDDDSDSETPPRDDKISPPRKWEIKDTIKEHVPVLVEIKKYPSRSLSKEEWRGRFHDGMAKARKDVVRQVNLPILPQLQVHSSLTNCLLRIQACFLFNCTRWKQQKAVLLIAAVGDYWEFAVLLKKQVRRLAWNLQNPGNDDNAEWTPKPELLDGLIDDLSWSGIAKHGSIRSSNHEEQVIGWVNAEYPNP